MMKNPSGSPKFNYRPLWMTAFSARDLGNAIPENLLRGRSAFNRDLGTIVHSNFFKRLSHKTQVFSLPYNDHVHTRLTHSVEAAQIGRHIARYFSAKVLRKLMLHEVDAYFKLSADLEELTAAACLAHDIGHSAFGHVGKKVIAEFCKEKRRSHKFDDNKQVVRILLNKLWFEKMNVSGPFVAAILKKRITSDNCYPSDKIQLTKIMKQLGLINLRHPASIFMEAADDIAYLSGDLLDYIAIYPGKSNFTKFSGYDALSRLNCVDQDGKEFSECLNISFDKALKERSNNAIQDFSDNFLRVALSHVFRTIDEFSNNLFSDPNSSLENLPEKLNKFSIEFAHEFKKNGKQKSDPNLVYSNLNNGDNAGKQLFVLKDELYNNSIFYEEFIHEQNTLATVVLNGILEKLYSFTEKKALSNKKLLADFPDDLRRYLYAAYAQGSLFPAIIDVVSGMTDRYAISFWKKVVGLSALERIESSSDIKKRTERAA